MVSGIPFVTNIIIRILIHVVNVLHLTSPAGRPFVTPWHSITRELSLCGNLSRAQRRVSVTAQLAPRAGRPQVATAGTVSFHSDLPPGEPQLETPGSPPERGPMVSPLGDSYRWQKCTAPQWNQALLQGATHLQRPLLRRSFTPAKLT